MTDPITVTIPDGRVLAVVDYDYTRGDIGTRLDPPTAADVSVKAARWLAPDGTATELTADELGDLHDGPEYDAILTAVEEIRGAELAAAMDDAETDEPRSLHDELEARGYTHEAIGEPGSGIRQVCRDGVAVFRGRCAEVWAWLRTTDAE
jgi:hypothetical protein